MLRCLECNTTIKKADAYHQLMVKTEITNMEMFGSAYQYEIFNWKNATDEEIKAYIDRYIPKHYCCECLDHSLGECIKERQRQQFNKAFTHAIARSTGVYRQGTL